MHILFDIWLQLIKSRNNKYHERRSYYAFKQTNENIIKLIERDNEMVQKVESKVAKSIKLKFSYEMENTLLNSRFLIRNTKLLLKQSEVGLFLRH